MSDFAKTQLAETGKELCEERDEARAVCATGRLCRDIVCQVSHQTENKLIVYP
jgi:hypothetical protein